MKQPTPEDLEEGTHVLYWGGYHGVIRDAYIPLDEFWVTDSETGQIVKDEHGQIVQFSAEQLQIVSQSKVPAPPKGLHRSAVMLLGREEPMMKILEHFGAPDSEERRNPQQLLAIPCHMCDPGQLTAAASEGVPEEVIALARRLRPDVHVGVRATQTKQAVDKIGPDLLRLAGYYCLAAVQLPFDQEGIEMEGLSEWDRHQRRNIYNQIDLGPTACTWHSSTETPETAARLALGETCGIEVSDLLWETEVQMRLRRRLELEFATSFKDASGANVSVVLLPDDVVATKIHGMLCFSEAPGADYTGKAAAGVLVKTPADAAAVASRGREQAAGLPEAAASAAREAPPAGSEKDIQGKTVRQWEEEQASEFAHLPTPPTGWLRVKSRKSGEVYFFNKKTQEATFDFPQAPLPPGWTKQISKSTGKTYYYHTEKKTSTFERPTL